MKPQHATGRRGGFTKWDLLICVVAVTAVAGFLLMPRHGSGAKRNPCVSNLKQVGLAFRMWSNDHGEKFPMASSALSTNGGTMEFNLTGEVWRHFQILSNELNSPKVLACPEDKQRSRTADWRDFTNNSHLSYFAGLDANETQPQSILSGDRNLTSATVKPVKGVLNLTTSDRIEWTGDIHNQEGNLVLGDGSAHQFAGHNINRQPLQAALLSTTQAVHRLALPE
jgi:hypothetical protein